MSKRKIAPLKARVKRLKGYWTLIAGLAGVSYMTIYRLKEGTWTRFKADTISRISEAVSRIERIA